MLVAEVFRAYGGTVVGVAVPDTRPVFLAVLGVHIAAGLAAVLAGAVAALARKAPGRHPFAGRVYLAAVIVLVGTAAVMTGLRWPHDLHLLTLGLLSAAAAGAGWEAHRQAWPGSRNRLRRHVLGMGTSFVLLLTAFYVDNGPELPVWDRLAPWSLWILPTVVAAPVIIWALSRRGLIAGPRRPLRLARCGKPTRPSPPPASGPR